MGYYLEHLCDGRSSLIADFVVSKVDACDGGVFLSEIEQKHTVSGGLTGVVMHGKEASIVGAHFGSHWVNRSADTDRESLGEFGPANVSDPLVRGHAQAGQVLVDL